MTASDVLIACFRRVFPTLSDAEIVAADMRQLAAWDSAAMLRLLAIVENEFAIHLDSADINQFTSFRVVLRVVMGRLRVDPSA